LGDLAGARQYVYSRRRHLAFRDKTLNELQEMARQMTHCRLDPVPVPFNLGQLEELYYRLECQRGDERVESLVGLRRDDDGVWRFSSL
jgi:hypothetical protein